MEAYLKRQQTIHFTLGMIIALGGFFYRLVSNRIEISPIDLATFGAALTLLGGAAVYRHILYKFLKGDFN